MTDLSVIIVAKTDTLHLMESINSVLPWVKEVIVIDIGIPESFLKEFHGMNVRVIPHSGDVKYADQIRNEVTKYAVSNYIFFLDPDEVVPEKLQTYIQENYSQYDVLSIPRKNIIFGKWIEHSRWWPDYQLRIYNKNKGSWNTSIHSKPEIRGTVHEIPRHEDLALIHYNYENLDHYFEKMTRYAHSEAEDYLKNNNDFTLATAFTKGVQEFISRFFAGEGYKDGMHGLVLAFLQSTYYPLVYFYYWEGKKYSPVAETEIVASVHNYHKELFLQSLYWISHKKLKLSISKMKYTIISFLSR